MMEICLHLPWVPAFESNGPILNATDSWCWLRKQRRLVGWTYTINWKTLEEFDVARIIANKKMDSVLPDNVRIAANTHTKCYIGKDDMLIGSFNITQPSIEDLCFLVNDKKLVKYMRTVFEQHWKALS